MRIESCKKCGTEQIASKNPSHKCVVCKEPTKLFCEKCNSYSEIQFHTHILDVLSRDRLLEIENNNYLIH